MCCYSGEKSLSKTGMCADLTVDFWQSVGGSGSKLANCCPKPATTPHLDSLTVIHTNCVFLRSIGALSLPHFFPLQYHYFNVCVLQNACCSDVANSWTKMSKIGRQCESLETCPRVLPRQQQCRSRSGYCWGVSSSMCVCLFELMWISSIERNVLDQGGRGPVSGGPTRSGANKAMDASRFKLHAVWVWTEGRAFVWVWMWAGGFVSVHTCAQWTHG